MENDNYFGCGSANDAVAVVIIVIVGNWTESDFFWFFFEWSGHFCVWIGIQITLTECTNYFLSAFEISWWSRLAILHFASW